MKNRKQIIKLIATLLIASVAILNISLSAAEIFGLVKERADNSGSPVTDGNTSDNSNSLENGGSADNSGEISSADIIDFHTIRFAFPSASEIKNPENIKVYADGAEMTATDSSFSDESNTGTVQIAETVDLSKAYTLVIEGYKEKQAIPGEIFDTDSFKNNFTYDGDDLGATVNGQSTTFKIWAPTASQVVLNLYESGACATAHKSVTMTKCAEGVWSYTVDCGHGTYYTYTVITPYGTSEAVDPYAKATNADGTRSAVVDLMQTNPVNWQKSFSTGITSYLDAVICEIDIAAFSGGISASNYKGKYLAFTESGLVNESGAPIGIDHLKNLGITHVKLLSVFDGSDALTQASYGCQINCNIPSGTYASDLTSADARIREFKAMVDALHSSGIGVIIEAAYNYTSKADKNLDKIVPYYYIRYSHSGTQGAPSAKAERSMYEKLMTDSVIYWLSEYGVDGFCFTNMNHHDLDTMQRIENAIHSAKPDAILFGECNETEINLDGVVLADRKNAGKITKTAGAIGSIAILNDVMRDGLIGGTDITSHGYINGNPQETLDDVLFGICGGNMSDAEWTATDSMLINSINSPRAISLWHKLSLTNNSDSEEERLAMYRLGIALLCVSKGAIIFPLGEEFLISQRGGNEVIDWTVISDESKETEMLEYFKSALLSRKNYRGFFGIGSQITYAEMLNGEAAVTVSDGADGVLFIILNPTSEAIEYTLDGEWYAVMEGTEFYQSQPLPLKTVATVFAHSITVLVNSAGIPD